MDEMTLTLNNPLTEEEWDLILDVDFDKTNSIEFHTKHGKTVKFVKCTDERSSDLISRQTAIAEFSCCELTPDGGIDANYAIEFLKQLPSVQPDKDINVPAKDCISRQSAINVADMADYTGMAVEDVKKVTDEVIKGLKNLPSAQPEGWLEKNKERILQAGMEGREIEFRIGGRLFAIREKAQ